ncbi:S8 family peptidase [Arsenicicoccus dermatophilus]|uniref:S8 family peptidase n=1 Tax=Arsenicicoccus dermatophilus TaxID=1076331 RepID=UPI003916F641
MARRRHALALTLSVATLLAGGAVTPAAGAAEAEPGAQHAVLVLARPGAQDPAVRAAITAAGGTVTRAEAAVGLYTVSTARPGFAADVRRSADVDTAAPDRVVGRVPQRRKPGRDEIERMQRERAAHPGPGRVVGEAATPVEGGKVDPTGEPLWKLQWDLAMIHTPAALRASTGRGVQVGVMDTGIDAAHPDLAANVDAALSRNFTKDIPEIDGPCAEDPDGSCEDPVTVDENGHGTHVASTIGAAVNGIGIAGVAPQADLVNLRVGQDSGYVFLGPVVSALVHAGSAHLDVVNMSFGIDPWAFNCADNPADTPEQQAQQRLTIEATNRALRYARDQGVTLVGTAGNTATDLDHPTVDDSSPDYPEGAAHPRRVDNSCLALPAEGDHVLTVTAVGPSTRKAYYSSYGLKAADLAAPGGDYRDFPGTERNAQFANTVLGALPKQVGIEQGSIDPATGAPTSPTVIRQGEAYYEYNQGTSMAAPHVAGVAALVIGARGGQGRQGPSLSPAVVERIVLGSATPHPCPTPATVVYPGVDPAYTATCTGSTEHNSFYGDGIVDAARAVSHRG